MKLRVEKRKPDVLDPTIYAVDNPAFPKRKQPSLSSSRTRMPKRNNKQTAPSSVLEKEDFVSDSFTDSIYDQDTICALCTGDRKMGIQMTKNCALDDLISPPKVVNEQHLEEDLTQYFMTTKPPQEVSTEIEGEDSTGVAKDHTLDIKGGWASTNGLDVGRNIHAKDTFLHLTCALFSPRSWLKEGNHWCNLKSEVIRSRHFKCSVCTLKGATVGCFHSNCRQIVHIPCAMKQGWKPTLSQKAYYCSTHLKAITDAKNGKPLVRNIDISRGYEILPVTMELCPCQFCSRAASLKGTSVTSSTNSSDTSSSTCSGDNSNDGVMEDDVDISSRGLLEAGIFCDISTVSTPLSTLASPDDANFLYITRNVDHEDVDSWPAKTNVIPYFCETCTDEKHDGLCAGADSEFGDASRCECAYQGILQTSTSTADLSTEGGNISENQSRVLEHTRDGSLADYRVSFECGLKCNCSSRRCNNRDIGRGMEFYLHIFVIPTVAVTMPPLLCQDVQYGVCSRNFIPKNSFVCEVIGQYRKSSSIIVENDVDATKIISLRKWCNGDMFWNGNSTDSSLNDEFSFIPEELCLDCRKFGNASRFIRHHELISEGSSASTSNLARKVVYIDHTCFDFPRLALFASRDIYAGEELLM